MPITPEDLGYGFGIPALAAMLAMVILRRIPPLEFARKYAPTVGLVLGFELGYWLLGLGELKVRPHFHWLPIAMVVVGVINIGVESTGASALDRLLTYVVVTLICGWFLVPTYKDLPFPWRESLAAWTAMVVILSLAFRPLVNRCPGTLLPAIYFVMAGCAAIVLLVSGSMERAQTAVAVAGAFLGLCLASLFDSKSQQLDGITFPTVFFFCSIMMIAQTNSFSQIPVPAYYLLPFAPVGLWLAGTNKSTGFIGGLLKFLVPVLICLAAVGWALYVERPWEMMESV